MDPQFSENSKKVKLPITALCMQLSFVLFWRPKDSARIGVLMLKQEYFHE